MEELKIVIIKRTQLSLNGNHLFFLTLVFLMRSKFSICVVNVLHSTVERIIEVINHSGCVPGSSYQAAKTCRHKHKVLQPHFLSFLFSFHHL